MKEGEERYEKKGTLPEYWSVGIGFDGEDGMAGYLMYVMGEYVPRAYFDYEWYLQKHPELVSICGTDKDAIYSYYANTGQAAGWHGRIAPDKLIGLSHFDYARYAAENPDVAAITGQNAEALYHHYVNSGIKEGRKGYATDETVNALVKMYEISSEIIKEDMSDEEKIKAVHDWMCLNIEYDYENYLQDTIPFASFEMKGAINNGRAVCAGYAMTFKIFMHIQGITCEKVSGVVDNEAHAWNRVKVGGEYYYIDVTWDDPDDLDDPEYIKYDYYMSKDSTFGGTHMSGEDMGNGLELW